MHVEEHHENHLIPVFIYFLKKLDLVSTLLQLNVSSLFNN